MGCIVDTDVCISLMKQNPDTLNRLNSLDSEFHLSFMSVSELFYGAYHSSREAYHLELTKNFINRFKILNPNAESCELFGFIKSKLKKEGQLIPDADLLIGSLAISYNSALFTYNTKHFERLNVFGLRLVK